MLPRDVTSALPRILSPRTAARSTTVEDDHGHWVLLGCQLEQEGAIDRLEDRKDVTGNGVA